jgi:hypothetical protein
VFLAKETPPPFFKMYSARRKISLCGLLSLARFCLDLRKGGNCVGRHLLAIGAKPRYARQYCQEHSRPYALFKGSRAQADRFNV